MAFVPGATGALLPGTGAASDGTLSAVHSGFISPQRPRYGDEKSVRAGPHSHSHGPSMISTASATKTASKVQNGTAVSQPAKPSPSVVSNVRPRPTLPSHSARSKKSMAAAAAVAAVAQASASAAAITSPMDTETNNAPSSSSSASGGVSRIAPHLPNGQEPRFTGVGQITPSLPRHETYYLDLQVVDTTPANAAGVASRNAQKTKSAPSSRPPRPTASSGQVVTANPNTPTPVRRQSGPQVDGRPARGTAPVRADAIANRTLVEVTPAAPKRKASRGPGVEDSIRSYLYEIGEVKLLDADAEVYLARDIARLLKLERISAAFREATGRDPTITEWSTEASMEVEDFRMALRRGLRAKERMVAANLRLVVSIAKKYLNRGLSFQDLIQEGSIGLIRGAEKFDGDKGFKFSTYATWWIRQAITRAIADHSRPIRLPVHVNDTISSIKKATRMLQEELGRAPVEEEIASRMGITVEKLRFITGSSRPTVSLETPIGLPGKDSSATLGSFIVDPNETPEEAAMQSLLREDLENVLNTLTPRERDVIRMRYGFDDGRMKTLEEIGVLFSVTRERIRQIEAKALRKLRHPNRNAVLREWVYEG